MNASVDHDSDEEVFFGPVSEDEVKKSSKYRRRTKLFLPGIRPMKSSSDCPETVKEVSDNIDEANKLVSADKGDNCGIMSSYNEAHSFSNKIESNSTIQITNQYEQLIGDGHDLTYQVEEFEKLASGGHNSTYSVDPQGSPIASTDEPDKDGGYLSVLSEAALYHASLDSQLVRSHRDESTQEEQTSQVHANIDSHEIVDLCSSQEEMNSQASLVDRYKEFGFGENDLEKQELTESIMYTTTRESTVHEISPSNGKDLVPPLSSEELCGNHSQRGYHPLTPQRKFTSLSTVDEVSVMEPSPNDLVSSIPGQDNDNNINSQNDELCGSVGSLKTADAPEVAENEDVEVHYLSGSDEGEIPNADSYVSEESGVWERNESISEEVNKSGVEQGNCSTTSSVSEYMNDTLEEYEMLMRYGIDYILGKKGSAKQDKPPSCADEPHSAERIVDSSSSYHEAEGEKKSSQMAGCHSSSLGVRAPLGSPTPQRKAVLPHSASSPAKLYGSNPPSRHADIPVRRVLSSVNSPARTVQTKSRLLEPTNRNTTVKTPSSKHGSGIPLPRVARLPLNPRSCTPSPLKNHGPSTPARTPGSFKKPVNPVSYIPKGPSHLPQAIGHPRAHSKLLDKIKSPVSAYIHNTPSPLLVTNVKAKQVDDDALMKERHARAVWRFQETGSTPKLVVNSENINPNGTCGLPSVKYTRAPCIKVDDTSNSQVLPHIGEKMVRLLDSKSPQVIKHEGRLRVDCRSPQYAAVVQSVHADPDDSMNLSSAMGDISVCVGKSAPRSNTLGQITTNNLRFMK